MIERIHTDSSGKIYSSSCVIWILFYVRGTIASRTKGGMQLCSYDGEKVFSRLT